MTLKEILSIIPEILQYFIPGYIFLIILISIISKKIENVTVKFIWSCVISYAIIAINNAVFNITDIWLDVLITIGMAIFLGILFAKLYLWKTFHKLIFKFFNKSPHDSIWRTLLDLKNGSNLIVFLKNSSHYIIGQYDCHEEKDDGWFCLTCYARIDIKTGNFLCNYTTDESCSIVFNIRDVESIQVFNKEI